MTTYMGRGLVNVISCYKQTFPLLQRYDEGPIAEPTGQMGGVLQSVPNARVSIGKLEADLIARGDATDLLSRERAHGSASPLGNLEQSELGNLA